MPFVQSVEDLLEPGELPFGFAHMFAQSGRHLRIIFDLLHLGFMIDRAWFSIAWALRKPDKKIARVSSEADICMA